MASPASTASVATPSAATQQLQVTVPQGIGPGMPFMVEPQQTGPLQVTCPQNATAGMVITVAVDHQEPQK